MIDILLVGGILSHKDKCLYLYDCSNYYQLIFDEEGDEYTIDTFGKFYDYLTSMYSKFNEWMD